MYYSKFNPYIRERVLLYFNSMKVDKEDKMPVQVSISVLVIAVAVSVMVTLFIGIVLGLLCGIKYMQKKLNSKQCFHTPEENVMSSRRVLSMKKWSWKIRALPLTSHRTLPMNK